MPSVSRSSVANRRGWWRIVIYGGVCSLVAVFALWATPKTPPTPSVSVGGVSQTAGLQNTALAHATANEADNDGPSLPVEALTQALNTTDPHHRAQRIHQLGASLAGDLDTAFHTLASLDSRDDRRAFIRGIFSVLAQGDPVRALNYVRQIGGDADREAALVALLHRWCGADLNSTEARQQNIAFYGLEAGLGMELLGGPSPRPDLASLWSQLATDDKGKLTLLAEITATQMATRAELAKVYSREMSRSDSLIFHNALAYALARKDPPAAWQWASLLDDPATRALAQKVVIGGWSERDPARAAQAAVALPPGTPQREIVLRQTATGYALQNADAADAWAHTLAESDAAIAFAAIESATSASVGLSLVSDGSGCPAINAVSGDSSADRSKQFQTGDHLVGISQNGSDFVDVTHTDLFKAARLMRGKPGSVVYLQVASLLADGGLASPRTVVLVRQ